MLTCFSGSGGGRYHGEVALRPCRDDDGLLNLFEGDRLPLRGKRRLGRFGLAERLSRLNAIHHRPGKPQKPTVMIVWDGGTSITGTYSTLRKPITFESGTRSVRSLYSRLLQEYRQHARVNVMIPVAAKNQDGTPLSITIVNIGAAGIGVNSKENITRGDVLSFSIVLPDLEIPLDISATVLWIRQYGAAGCEFTSITEPGRRLLHEWLERRCLVKKPLVGL